MNGADESKGTASTALTGWRAITALLFILALVSIIALLSSDALHHLRYSVTHQRTAAVPLILIGLSYISLQFSARRQRAERVKGILLGVAFVLWGAEQLLPPTSLVTVMDASVVTIFVVDLSLIIVEHLRRKDHDLP